MFRSPALIGAVSERKPLSVPKSPTNTSEGQGGFPAVQHRSKSAFARGREELSRRQASTGNPGQVPAIKPSKPPAATQVNGTDDANDWRKQVSEENQRKVEAMTDDERAAEVGDILQRFGANVGDILLRAREKRAQMETEGPSKRFLAAPTKRASLTAFLFRTSCSGPR
jgi:RNA polymerase II-associated protein 1